MAKELYKNLMTIAKNINRDFLLEYDIKISQNIQQALKAMTLRHLSR